MPSLHNQGMQHQPFTNTQDDICFLCNMTSKICLTTIVITRRRPGDTITRENVCEGCLSKLPTERTRLATDKENNLYMIRWMNVQFGPI